MILCCLKRCRSRCFTLEWLWHQSDSFVKPGSHLPPSYLRHDSDIVASTFCNTVPIWEQKSPATAEVMSVFTAGMPAKLTRVRLRTHAGGKDLRCFLSRRRYVLICRSSIAGSSGGMWEPGLTCFCGLDLNSTIFIFYTNKNVALIFSVSIRVQKQQIVHRHGVPNRCFYK